MDPPSKLAPALRQPGGEPRRRPTQLHRGRIAAAIAIAVLGLALIAWLVLRDGNDASTADGPVSSAASAAALRSLPAQAGHAVYWAGPLAGHTYEVTRPLDGNVYVRYLPRGVPVGDRRPDFTTVGTYPRDRALQGLRRLSRRAGTAAFRLEGGGLAVYVRNRPSSVYLAFPGENVQIEVYDPSPPKARRLARSGRVRPIGSG